MSYGTVTVDGEPVEDAGEDVERIHLGFDEDGYLIDCDRADCRAEGEHVAECDYAGETFPMGVTAWCNSAAISVDDADDSVSVSISVGDPRGAFVMTVRRVEGDDGAGLVLSVPDPSDGFLHMPLKSIHDGYFRIGS